MFLISDGRPQDRGYSREGVEKEYAVYDTRQALIEARQQGITPFCLTVDKSGHDYLKTMMDDFSYEVLSDKKLKLIEKIFVKNVGFRYIMVRITLTVC